MPTGSTSAERSIGSHDSSKAGSQRTRLFLCGAAVSALGIAVFALELGQGRAGPARCAPGFEPQTTRCCAPGQTEQSGLCTGTPTTCPPAPNETAPLKDGCVPPSTRRRLAGGELELQPIDWGAAAEPRRIVTGEFWLDDAEVTERAYAVCVHAGICAARKSVSPDSDLPVVNVTPEEADTYCRFVGGRLPTDEQWLFAAAGSKGRRYPWGPTGLVCRRAVFGLQQGPCATGGLHPEWPRSRPTGQTPDGIFDLAGNVAEWTRGETGFQVRGGSFRSQVASELKTWSTAPPNAGDTVGFRCAYDSPRPGQ